MTLSTEKILQFIDSRRTAPIVWGAVLLLSLLTLAVREPDTSQRDIRLIKQFVDSPGQETLVIFLIHLVATGLSCMLLLHLNNANNLMQQRTWLPATLLLFFNACDPTFADSLNIGILLSPLLVLLLHWLFSSYQKEGQQAAYGIGLLITACALIWPSVIGLIVPFFIGIAYMQVLTWRSATALLLGIATPVWLLFCTSIVFELHPIYRLDAFVSLHTELPLALQIESATDMMQFVIIGIIGLCCCVSDSYLISRHRIQIWRSNRFLLLLFVFSIGIGMLNPAKLNNWLPILHIIGAQSAAYYLIHARNAYAPWQACTLTGIYLFLYIWNF